MEGSVGTAKTRQNRQVWGPHKGHAKDNSYPDICAGHHPAVTEAVKCQWRARTSERRNLDSNSGFAIRKLCPWANGITSRGLTILMCEMGIKPLVSTPSCALMGKERWKCFASYVRVNWPKGSWRWQDPLSFGPDLAPFSVLSQPCVAWRGSCALCPPGSRTPLFLLWWPPCWPGSFLSNSIGPYLPGPQRATPLGLASPSEAAAVSILLQLHNERENQSMLSLSLIFISLLQTKEDLNHFLQKNPS